MDWSIGVLQRISSHVTWKFIFSFTCPICTSNVYCKFSPKISGINSGGNLILMKSYIFLIQVYYSPPSKIFISLSLRSGRKFLQSISLLHVFSLSSWWSNCLKKIHMKLFWNETKYRGSFLICICRQFQIMISN